MNKHVLKYAAALALILTGAGCDYNEENFEGLQEGTVVSNVITLDMTLTDADYEAIATNKSNQALAGDDKSALSALSTAKYFTPTITAAKYVPNFLANLYPTADNTSSIKVTSNVVTDLPEELTAIQAAKEYVLASADYKAAWEDGTIKFFTPSKPAEEFIPGILAGAIDAPESGDMAMVTYKYYNGEPEADEPATAAVEQAVMPRAAEAVTVTPIGTIIETLKAGSTSTVYTAEGNIVGIYAQGLLIKDQTGTMCVYVGKNYGRTGYALGDKIRVTGTTQMRYDAPQFNNSGIELALVAPRTGNTEFAYPAPTTVTAATIPSKLSYTPAAYTEYEPFAHLSVTGTVIKSGNYFNLKIEGAADDAFMASLTNPFESMQFSDELVNKTVTVTGYVNTINSGSKFFGLICTSLTTEGTTQTQLGVAASKAGNYTSQGVVVGTYARGFMMNDGTANMLVYENKLPSVAIGDIVKVSGDAEVRYSMAQFKSSATVTKVGTVADVATVRPAVAIPTGEELTAYVANPYYRYVQYTGQLTTNDNGYYEIHGIEGTDIFGSVQYALDEQSTLLAKLKGKEVKVTGYLIGTNAGKTQANTMVLSIESSVSYDTETRNALYVYDGSKWAPETEVVCLQPADYESMGLNNANFSSSKSPESYLPAFLKLTKPYAQPEDALFIAYNYYNGSAVVLCADQYLYDGMQWTKNLGIVEQTDQFVKGNNVWVWDPSVRIILPTGKGQPLTTLYFQTCVDWVRENVPNGDSYVTSYGDGEFYTGASAYYGNLDWTPSKAAAQYPEGYRDMDDAQITEALKQHTIEAFAGVLSILHADAKPAAGVEVTYTIQLGIYTGSTVQYQLVYKVVGPGQFEYVPDSFQAI